MTATYTQARADMFGIIRAARDAGAVGIHTRWQGKPHASNAPPPADDEWISVSIQHSPTGSRQASLGCQHGLRRWRRTGRLYVQCFAPLQKGGLVRAMELACLFRDAIQTSGGTPNGVWFREPTASEVPPEKNWECATASAAFTYDEVK